MILNFKIKKYFLFLIIFIILILIIIYLFFIIKKGLKSISVKEYFKNELKKIYKKNIYNVETNYIDKISICSDTFNCYLKLSFDELDFLINESKKININLDDNLFFYKNVLNYIKNDKNDYFLNYCLFKKNHFINNMPTIIKNKYSFIIEKLKTKKTILVNKKKFEEYINLLGIFLANYKYSEINNKFILKFSKKTLNLKNQSDFKKTLVFTWKLGSFICKQINNCIIPKDEIFIFNNFLEKIILITSNDKREFPLGFDWFLFASHYPTIISYKLFIDYKTKKIVSEKYISEILKYIPNINYSKNIKRYKSNAAILSINYIIAHLFKFRNKIEEFTLFIEKILNSDIYNNDIKIQYQEPFDNIFIDGLYFDGGFIIHKNLVSYNYLLAYLYPSLFYKVLFDQDTDNIYKILKALSWLIIPARCINPVIISRYGKFNEVQNVLHDFENNSKLMNVNTNLKSYLNVNLEDILGIKVVESVRLVIANFLTWSIQIKINSELAYGETDLFNRQYLKQISMNKIMFFNDVKEIGFTTDSLYPGVLSYKQFLDNAEKFDVKYGTKTYVFKNVKYTFIQLDRNTIVVYTVVTNEELKLSYEELILITKYGIFVGYFNINKMLNDDLYLTIESDIINKNVKSGILFSDDESETIKYKNGAIIKKVNKHVLYYNHIFSAPKVSSHVNIYDNDEIKIIIKFNKIYYINLNNKIGLFAHFLN